jgi:hypothetical protein
MSESRRRGILTPASERRDQRPGLAGQPEGRQIPTVCGSRRLDDGARGCPEKEGKGGGEGYADRSFGSFRKGSKLRII